MYLKYKKNFHDKMYENFPALSSNYCKEIQDVVFFDYLTDFKTKCGVVQAAELHNSWVSCNNKRTEPAVHTAGSPSFNM